MNERRIRNCIPSDPFAPRNAEERALYEAIWHEVTPISECADSRLQHFVSKLSDALLRFLSQYAD